MKERTRLTHLGRNPSKSRDATVNVPVHRASTIVSPTLDDYLHRFDDERRFDAITYGATGTQNNQALADAMNAFENGAGTVITSSGLSACTIGLGALVSQGDHVLVTDSVYGPLRTYCDSVLSRYGIETTFYDPRIGSDIEALMRPNTRVIYTEAPGSFTFEMQDIDAIVDVAHRHDALVCMDNTWATPVYYKPIDHGVDVSIQAGTKYVAGHSDLVIGMIALRDRALYKQVRGFAMTLGDVSGPDDSFLALRGLRTMELRMQRQFESAMRIAEWIKGRPEVLDVLYPPLESDPGHALYKRQFTGGASLFGLALKEQDLTAIARMVDGLELFSIGSSWGGYESLIAVKTMPIERNVLPWTKTDTLLRLHIGLEDPDDLIDDLTAGFRRLTGA